MIKTYAFRERLHPNKQTAVSRDETHAIVFTFDEDTDLISGRVAVFVSENDDLNFSKQIAVSGLKAFSKRGYDLTTRRYERHDPRNKVEAAALAIVSQMTF